MDAFYITFRSVTHAQRGERILKGGGIRCSLRRTPRWMEEQGCGYCVGLDASPERAMALLRGAQIPWRRVYRRREDGGLEVWEN